MPTTEHIAWRNGALHIEALPLADIAAEVETPCYCYSAAAIAQQYRALADALDGLPARIHYSVKANAGLAVLRLMANLGAGADVVSEGEIRRALAAGIAARDIIFSGAGKSAAELAFALDAGIAQINVESEAELRLLSSIAARRNAAAHVALRINPDIDAQTHRKITTGTKANKFGVPWQDAAGLFAAAANLPGIRMSGLAMHIGSQITSAAPFHAAFERLAGLAAELRGEGFAVESLDLGGGLGADYGASTPGSTASTLDVREYAAAVRAHFAAPPCRLLFEPGRFLVADAGVLLTRLLYEKHAGDKRFLIVDAAMNDLLRPALYDARHDIVPVNRPAAGAAAAPADIVGPVCETSDTLARNCPLPPLAAGDLLAVLQAGAYGASLASMYNSRPLAPEVLVSGARMAIVRRRPSHAELLAAERIPDWLETT